MQVESIAIGDNMSIQIISKQIFFITLLLISLFFGTGCSGGSGGGKGSDVIPTESNGDDNDDGSGDNSGDENDTEDDTSTALKNLSFDPRENAYYPVLTEFDNAKYVVYSQLHSSRRVRVQKWNGSNWNFVDGPSNCLNYDANEFAYEPQLIVFQSTLYSIWYEFNNGIRQIRVKKFDGSDWQFIDGGGENGINYNTAKNSYNPKLVVFDSQLYALWTEDIGSGNREKKVKRFTGNSWESASEIPSGSEYHPALNSDDPQISIFNLY